MMNKQEENSNKKVKWKIIMDLQCCRLKNENITSYGDWGIVIYYKDANKVDKPILEIMRKKEMENDDQEAEFKVENYPQLTNAKQALKHISVNINISEEEFINRYGFWQISEFTVYNNDGNYCAFSFRTKDKFYRGSYSTS